MFMLDIFSHLYTESFYLSLNNHMCFLWAIYIYAKSHPFRSPGAGVAFLLIIITLTQLAQITQTRLYHTNA